MGQKLVTALPYLTPDLVVGKVVSKMPERFLPGFCMKVHRVKQGSIDVKDYNVSHSNSASGTPLSGYRFIKRIGGRPFPKLALAVAHQHRRTN
jgi:hypothetical protein